MDIDLNILRSLESEKDISMELVIKAIEDALLIAYHRTEGAVGNARVELDRGSDTYSLELHKITRRGLNVRTAYEADGVYAGQLKSTIEAETGLYLSL